MLKKIMFYLTSDYCQLRPGGADYTRYSTPKTHMAFLLSMVALLTFICDAAATDFYCNNKIISVGDAKYDVLTKCSPDFTDGFESELIQKTGQNEWRKMKVKRETFLYNFGPNAFVRIVIIENDRVVEIKTGEYGCAEKDIGAFAGDDAKIKTGMTSLEVSLRWGAPTYRSDKQEERFVRLADGSFMKNAVTISEWFYNLGPDRLTRILTFENSQLSQIRNGDYGSE